MNGWLAKLASWRWRTMWVVIAVIIAVIGVVIPLPLGPTVIRMQGSNTIGSELAPDLVLGFLRSRNPGPLATGIDRGTVTLQASDAERPLRFDIQSSGSETAFDCGVDISMSSRPIRPDESKRLEECGGERKELLLASDAVAVVANPGIKLPAISVDDLRRVFRCEVRDWSQIGIAGGPIKVLRRGDDSGTTELFRDRVLNGLPFCADAQEFDDSQELSERVAQTPGAIGFVGLPFVGTNSVPSVVSGPDAAPLAPTEENVRSGVYPLSRSLFLYTPESMTSAVTEFLEYARGCEGQRQVDDDGFFRGQFLACEESPQENSAAPVALPITPCPQGAPADYCTFVARATRLPFAIRFDASSGAVDERGSQDLGQFVSLLRGLGGRRTVLLAGFTDAAGVPVRNEVLARERAQAVEKALRATLESNRVETAGIQSDGFGPRYLVDDNSAVGQQRNRRVEVWLR